jgi:hypothetical protein
MSVLARTGAGPLDADIALPGGLFQASKAHALAEIRTVSRALTARQSSLPYDQDRIGRFGRLIAGLRESTPQDRPVRDARDARYNYLPFFEAYFSNFIEGTEFELDEAIAVVYDGRQIPGRARG